MLQFLAAVTLQAAKSSAEIVARIVTSIDGNNSSIAWKENDELFKAQAF